MIPTTSSRVRVQDLHPTLHMRVDAWLNDSRMKGYRVSSGVRTYAQQKALYSGWKSRLPGYNLAANPDAAGPPTFDGLAFRGSYHMIQDDNFGHAVDIRRPYPTTWTKAHRVANEYGLRPVLWPREGWHFQARDRYHWFPAPRIAVPSTTLPTKEFDMQYVADQGDVWLIGPGWHRDVGVPPSGATVDPIAGLSYILADMEASGVSKNITDARKS